MQCRFQFQAILRTMNRFGSDLSICVGALLLLPILSHQFPAQVPIQSFHTTLDEPLSVALHFSLDRLNSQMPRTFLLQHKHKMLMRLRPDDAWGLMAKVCAELEQPGFVMALVGEWRQRSHEPFAIVSAGMEVPLINWALSPRVFETGGNNDFEVSIQPPNAEFLAELMAAKNWTRFVYLHDWENANKAAQTLRLISRHWRKIGHKSAVATQMAELPKHSSEFRAFFEQFLSERDKSNGTERVLLDAANPHRQQRMLQALRSVPTGHQSSSHYYLVANFDLLPSEVESLQQAAMNVVGGQLVDRASHEYGQLVREMERARLAGIRGNKAAIDLEASRLSFVHDALVVAKATIQSALRMNQSLFMNTLVDGRLHNKGFPGIRCHADNFSAPLGPFELGRDIARTMNRLRLDAQQGTLTGHIEFDANGVRRNFDVKVVELAVQQEGDRRRKRMTRVWRHSVGFLAEQQHQLQSRSQRQEGEQSAAAKSRPIRAVTVLVDPFVMLKPQCKGTNGTTTMAGECEGNNRFEGYCVDLLKLLSAHIADFQYEVFLSEDNKYGSEQTDGSWDGIIGYLLRGEADISVASLTINQKRERVVDFSQPFMTTGISIMIQKPDKQEFSLLRFMAPLSHEVWLCIMFAFIGVSVVIYLLARLSPFEQRPEEENSARTEQRGNSLGWTVFNSLWFTWASLLGGGSDLSPSSFSVRIASSTWFFFTLIMVSSYTANLAAFLTIERMNTPIEGVEDLAKQTKIKYGIQQGGSTEQFFKHSSVQIYQQMWTFMEGHSPSVFVDNYAEGIAKVRESEGRYAFLLEATANEFANMRLPCNTMKVGEDLNSIGYGVATPFGSDWKDHINLAILALQETGQLRKLRNKWWYEQGQCSEESGGDPETESLTLDNVAGVFYVLIGGMVIAMAVAFCERVYRLPRMGTARVNRNSQDTRKPKAFGQRRGGEEKEAQEAILSSGRGNSSVSG